MFCVERRCYGEGDVISLLIIHWILYFNMLKYWEHMIYIVYEILKSKSNSYILYFSIALLFLIWNTGIGEEGVEQRERTILSAVEWWVSLAAGAQVWRGANCAAPSCPSSSAHWRYGKYQHYHGGGTRSLRVSHGRRDI